MSLLYYVLLILGAGLFAANYYWLQLDGFLEQLVAAVGGALVALGLAGLVDQGEEPYDDGDH